MGSYSLYGSWSHEEAGDVGKEFRAICHANYGYERHLTEGKEYLIRIEPRIMPLSPLCSFVSDKDETKRGECHLERFTKVED